jgi:DNA polymerase-3 subunit beta
MGENGLRITVQTTDQGASTEDVDATFQGTEITAAFNADYLLDGVDATVGEEVSIESTEPNKPAVIRGVGDDSYLYLLMPQRV